MADDCDNVRIGDEPLGDRDRLSRTVLVIHGHEDEVVARQHRTARIGLVNGELRSLENILTDRGLIASEWAGKADLDRRRCSLAGRGDQ